MKRLPILAVAAVLLFLSDHEAGGNYGLVQRLSLGAGAFWIFALCAGLLYVHRRDGPALAPS